MVAKSQYGIRWTDDAADQFAEILEYILLESPAGATIVKNAVFDRVRQLDRHPFMYDLDVLCEDNDGSYRAFTVYHYRITYRISENEVVIIRIRHTSREPEVY